jgi:hypothetical protein
MVLCQRRDGVGKMDKNDIGPKHYGPSNPATTPKEVRERIRFYDLNEVWQWASVSEVLVWSSNELDRWSVTGMIPERLVKDEIK